MIRGIFGDLSANGERQRAAEVLVGKPVNAMMQFPQLQLTDAERAVLTGHLRDSASMVQSQYKTGGKVERTERIIDILNVIAEAAGTRGPSTSRSTSTACRPGSSGRSCRPAGSAQAI